MASRTCAAANGSAAAGRAAVSPVALFATWGSIRDAPAVREPDEAQFPRRAGDDERALDVVEQAHAFGIERVRADEILARATMRRAATSARTRTVPGDAAWARRHPYPSPRRRRACRRRGRCRSSTSGTRPSGENISPDIAQIAALHDRSRRLDVERLDRVNPGRRGYPAAIGCFRRALFSSWKARYACVTSAAGP